MQNIEAEQLLRDLAGNEPVRVLDVRRRQAYESDPVLIPGAEWRAPDTVASWARELSKDTRIVVYCVHGHEVGQGVAAHLHAAGYRVQYLEGGLEGWKHAGGVTVNAPQQAARRGRQS